MLAASPGCLSFSLSGATPHSAHMRFAVGGELMHIPMGFSGAAFYGHPRILLVCEKKARKRKREMMVNL